MKKFLFKLLLLLTICASLNAEKKCRINFQKLGKHTFKIDVSPFTDAFNPSLCQLGDEYLLTFRYLPEPIRSPWISYVGIMRLDKNFARISKPQLLDIRKDNVQVPSQSEDARIFTYKDKLYIIYNDNCDVINPSGNEYREMFIAEVYYADDQFQVGDPIKIIHKENHHIHKWEKNWTPFVYQDSLLMYYSIGPNQILNVNWETEECCPLYTTSPDVKWQWGKIRGGTPAQLVDGQYLAFFHSSMNLYSNVSADHPRWHYFMGAYTFSAEPPFKMLAISSEPINGENFYVNSEQPKRVVYPGGFVVDGSNIYVSYGKDDHEVWIAVIDKKMLMRSLRPVEKRSTRHGRNS